MIEIGKYNTLKVVKELEFGMALDGAELGNILLPRRYVTEDMKIDDDIEVFIYRDSEDRLVATTETPLATVGDFALLEVVEVTSVGAFLDWGLQKHLLVPFREQKQKLQEGRSYLVRVYLDEESDRIVGSSKLDKFLDNIFPDYEIDEEVDLIIADATEIGFKAIINETHWGVLYRNEVFKPLKLGDRLKGFIKKVREDQKIDLCLQKAGFEKIDYLADEILSSLKEGRGFIALTDKSPAQDIKDRFKVSKKTFKKAIGALYKKHFITIEPNGIRLVE